MGHKFEGGFENMSHVNAIFRYLPRIVTTCDYDARTFYNVVSGTSLFFGQKDDNLIFTFLYIDNILSTGFDSLQINKLIRDLNVEFSDKDLG